MADFRVETRVEKLMGDRMPKMDIGIGLSVLDNAYPGYYDDIDVFLKAKGISDEAKRFNISHDIYGMKSGDKFFMPRLAGYARRNSHASKSGK